MWGEVEVYISSIWHAKETLSEHRGNLMFWPFMKTAANFIRM